LVIEYDVETLDFMELAADGREGLFRAANASYGRLIMDRMPAAIGEVLPAA
jgi:hypothetical protein